MRYLLPAVLLLSLVGSAQETRAPLRRFGSSGFRERKHLLGARFAPDGERIVTHSQAGRIAVWTLEGEQVRAWPTWVRHVRYTDGGKAIAAIRETELEVYDLKSGMRRGTTRVGRRGYGQGVALSPDGTLLVTAHEVGRTRTIFRLWNVVTGKQTATWEREGNRPSLMAISPDNTRLATMPSRGLRLWDLNTRTPIGEPTLSYRVDGPLVFSPDSKRLAFGYLKGVMLWDLDPDKKPRLVIDQQHRRRLSLSFSPDGRTLACAGYDRLRLIDIARGKVREFGEGNTVAYSPDGKRLVTTSARTIALWDPATGKLLTDPGAGHSGSVWGVALSADGKRLFSGADELLCWDVESGKLLRKVSGVSKVTALALSRGDRRLAIGRRGFGLSVRDPDNDKELAAFKARSFSVSWVRFSPDGKLVFTAPFTNTLIRVWRADDGSLLLPRSSPAAASAFSHDGKLLATAHRGVIRIWRLSDATLLRMIPTAEKFYPHQVAFSPRGTYVGASGNKGDVRVWLVSSGENVVAGEAGRFGRGGQVEFTGDEKIAYWSQTIRPGSTTGLRLFDLPSGRERMRAHDAALSPDGTRLALIKDLQTVLIKRTDTGQLLLRLKLFSRSLAWTADGKRLAVSSGGEVHVFDSTTGKPTSTLTAGGGGLGQMYRLDVRFTPDGKRLIGSGTDSAGKRCLYVWDLSSGKQTQAVPDHALAVVTRDSARMMTFEGRERTPHLWELASGQRLRAGDWRTAFRKGVYQGSLALSPDGKRISAGIYSVGVWTVDDRERVMTLRPLHGEELVGFAAIGEGRYRMASRHADGLLTFWEYPAGRLLGRMQHPEEVLCVFAPDGKRVAIGGKKQVLLVDVATGETLRTLTARVLRDGLTPLHFDASGSVLVARSLGKVHLWNVDTGKRLLENTTNRRPLLAPDGKRLALLQVGQVSIVDLARGRIAMTLSGRGADFYRGAWSADGERFAGGTAAGTVLVWSTAVKK